MSRSSKPRPRRTRLAFALCLLSGAWASPALAQPSVYNWIQVPGLLRVPAPEAQWQLAYDIQNQHVVAVARGGSDNRTWFWDGTEWTDAGLPSPIDATGIVYDVARGAAVRLQYTSALQPMVTYVLVAAGWIPVDSDGPTSRQGFGFAYDSLRERAVVWGGAYFLNGVETAYTWEWDGLDWTPYDTLDSAPPRRTGTAMVYDEKDHVTVMFGGITGNSIHDTFFGDTWTWDGQNWTQVASSGPSPRASHSMIYDPLRQRILLFGGYDNHTSNVVRNDLWEWNGSSWTQINTTGPSGRTGAGFAYDRARTEAVLYSGFQRDADGFPVPLSDTWRLRIREAWVDYHYSGVETGAFATPFNTTAEAVVALPAEGWIHYKPGIGTETLTITKRLLLDAPLGTVVVGP